MKVTVLTTSFPRSEKDFAGRFIYDLSKLFARAGIETCVIAPSSDDRTSDLREPLLSVKRFRYFWPRSFQRLAYRYGVLSNLQTSLLARVQLPFFFVSFVIAAMRASRYSDIIHAHWTPVGLVGLIVGKLLSKPVVLTVHGSDARNLPRPFSNFIFRRVDAVIAPTIEMRDTVQDLGLQKCHLIPLPIDDQRIGNLSKSLSLGRDLSLKEFKHVVVFIGRLDPFKDPLTLINAIPSVLEHLPDTGFLIVGDGILRFEVEKQTHQLGIEENVLITGSRGDVYEILASSTLFVALSPIENVWSMTIVEAMSIGVPCIITQAGHTAEIFHDSVDAILIEPKNPTELASAICSTLNDKAMRESLVANARLLLEHHGRDSDSILRRHRELYQHLMVGRGNRE